MVQAFLQSYRLKDVWRKEKQSQTKSEGTKPEIKGPKRISSMSDMESKMDD